MSVARGAVPQAITAFLESHDYESAVRLAISLGGDSDTIGCITGGIAQAFYKEIPLELVTKTMALLPEEFVNVITEFDKKYQKQA